MSGLARDAACSRRAGASRKRVAAGRGRRTSAGRAAAFGLLAILILSACTEVGYLDRAEKDLGIYSTWYGADFRIYHSALFSPQGEALGTQGYVVGIERLDPVSGATAGDASPSPPAGYNITHVVRYDRGAGDESAPPVKSCVLFTMIDRSDPEAVRERADAGVENAGRSVFRRCSQAGPVGTYAKGEDALKHDLERVLRAREASHIVLVVMGWNTDQTEAIKNYNAIAGNLAIEARQRGMTDFRPLVIGVTWPSLWRLSSWSVVPDAVVRGLSFPWISDAADEIGNHIITYAIQSILEARKEAGGAVPVTLIGHSFGARVLEEAIKQAWAGGIDGFPAQRDFYRPSDRLILLEGAFEIHRIFGDDGTLHPAFRSPAPRVTMTASKYDNAVAAAIWGWYAGDIRSFDEVCRNNTTIWRYASNRLLPASEDLAVAPIGCGVAQRPDVPPDYSGYGYQLCQANYVPGPVRRPLGNEGFRYVDASYVINCNEPFTGGGAHSDIYRAETARFILDEMK